MTTYPTGTLVWFWHPTRAGQRLGTILGRAGARYRIQTRDRKRATLVNPSAITRPTQ
ncbi:hypothetical protein HQ520_05470 [bacterium]|nr:hypothetical protein [bacterium]